MALLTIQQAARELAVSDDTVRRIIDKGMLTIVKVTDTPKGRRIHPDDLNAYIEGSRCRSQNRKMANGLSR